MPLGREKDKEKKRGERGSYCSRCRLATLYPDGAVRCDLTREVVEPSRPACKKRIAGMVKVLREEKISKAT